MSTTPYELRYKLLTTAEERLRTEYFAKIETLQILCDRADLKLTSEMMPKFPTKEETFLLAEEFKQFVETK
jgi:hypothetical protein